MLKRVDNCRKWGVIMQLVILIILGLIQGLTEFLPVSSSGHLILLYNIFGIENNTVLLSIILHVATLLAVLWHYRKDILILIRHPLCPTNRKILVTTIFSCIMVVLIKPIIDYGFGGDFLSTFFMITAILLFVSDIISEKRRRKLRIANTPKNSFTDPTSICDLPLSYGQAIIIGLSQGIACIPGISRSGTTIATAKMCGVDDCSTKYSFLISIPIILGSMLLEILDGGNLQGISIFGVIISFIVCFFVGLICIKLMNKITQSDKLYIFSFYLFILSLFLIINSLWLHLF